MTMGGGDVPIKAVCGARPEKIDPAVASFDEAIAGSAVSDVIKDAACKALSDGVFLTPVNLPKYVVVQGAHEMAAQSAYFRSYHAAAKKQPAQFTETQHDATRRFNFSGGDPARGGIEVFSCHMHYMHGERDNYFASQGPPYDISLTFPVRGSWMLQRLIRRCGI